MPPLEAWYQRVTADDILNLVPASHRKAAVARIEAATVVHEMFDRAPIDAEVNNLLDVVMRFAPDLITQVPPPPAELLVSGRKPILEVVRKENGRAVAEVSL